jgi:RNA polymerase sigma-70 factor, ECF subfamily
MIESDETLYAKVLAGRRNALTGLVDRYHAPLYRLLYYLTGHPQTAEDLVQDAFLRALAYRGSPPDSFKAWIFAIARNLAIDHFRSAAYRREEGLQFDDDLPVPLNDSILSSAFTARGGPSAEHEFIAQVEGKEVVAALQQLSPLHRETLVLRYYYDLKLEEIAAITGAPLGTVKSRLFNALGKLKAFLEREEARAYE